MTRKRQAPKKSLPKMSILFVDDDALFCRLIERTAEQMGLAVLTCRTRDELQLLAVPNTFDVAVVDYYLDGGALNMRGSAVARWLGRTPVVLTSRDERCRFDSDIWPMTVKRFVDKSLGPRAILETALTLKPTR